MAVTLMFRTWRRYGSCLRASKIVNGLQSSMESSGDSFMEARAWAIVSGDADQSAAWSFAVLVHDFSQITQLASLSRPSKHYL